MRPDPLLTPSEADDLIEGVRVRGYINHLGNQVASYVRDDVGDMTRPLPPSSRRRKLTLGHLRWFVDAEPAELRVAATTEELHHLRLYARQHGLLALENKVKAVLGERRDVARKRPLSRTFDRSRAALKHMTAIATAGVAHPSMALAESHEIAVEFWRQEADMLEEAQRGTKGKAPKPKAPKEPAPAPVDPAARKPLPHDADESRVRHLQNRLTSLGKGLASDGHYGPKTDAAIREFQAEHNLKVDGIVGPKTTNALRDPESQKTAPAPVLPETKPEDGLSSPGAADTPPMLYKGVGVGEDAPNAWVRELQDGLGEVGYEIEADGRFGPETEGAVKRMQRKYGLKPDGLVGPKTSKALDGVRRRRGALEEALATEADPRKRHALAAELRLLREDKWGGKPGPNHAQVTPENKKKLSGLVKHYMKKPHPFTSCVRDNTKRFGKEGAERVCAVVKDIGHGGTGWRKGSKKLSEAAESILLDTAVEDAVERLVEAGVNDENVPLFAAWMQEQMGVEEDPDSGELVESKSDDMKRCPNCKMRVPKGKTKCTVCKSDLPKKGDGKLEEALAADGEALLAALGLAEAFEHLTPALRSKYARAAAMARSRNRRGEFMATVRSAQERGAAADAAGRSGYRERDKGRGAQAALDVEDFREAVQDLVDDTPEAIVYGNRGGITATFGNRFQSANMTLAGDTYLVQGGSNLDQDYGPDGGVNDQAQRFTDKAAAVKAFRSVAERMRREALEKGTNRADRKPWKDSSGQWHADIMSPEGDFLEDTFDSEAEAAEAQRIAEKVRAADRKRRLAARKPAVPKRARLPQVEDVVETEYGRGVVVDEEYEGGNDRDDEGFGHPWAERRLRVQVNDVNEDGEPFTDDVWVNADDVELAEAAVAQQDHEDRMRRLAR